MELQNRIKSLTSPSMQDKEYLLDVDFIVEMEGTVKRLKRRKASDPDNLMAEHLRKVVTE